jgi:hypothetical protein
MPVQVTQDLRSPTYPFSAQFQGLLNVRRIAESSNEEPSVFEEKKLLGKGQAVQ